MILFIYRFLINCSHFKNIYGYIELAFFLLLLMACLSFSMTHNNSGPKIGGQFVHTSLLPKNQFVNYY